MAGGNANTWRINCCEENIKSSKEYREHRHEKHGEKVIFGVSFVEGAVREEVAISDSDESDNEWDVWDYGDGEEDD